MAEAAKRKARIVELYQNGVADAAIACQVGVQKRYVQHVLQTVRPFARTGELATLKLQVAILREQERKARAELRALAAEARKRHSAKAVARVFGVHFTTVRTWSNGHA